MINWYGLNCFTYIHKNDLGIARKTGSLIQPICIYKIFRMIRLNTQMTIFNEYKGSWLLCIIWHPLRNICRKQSANRANTTRDLINTCMCFVVYHIICEPHRVVQLYFHCILGVISKYIQANLVALYAIRYIRIYICMYIYIVVKSKLRLNVSRHFLHWKCCQK